MYCPKCGARNNDDNAYCVSCGTNLKATPTMGFSTGAEPPPPPPPARPAAHASSVTGGGQAYAAPMHVGTRPENHLLKAILVTLFCCLPMGIAAIVNAAKVDGAWDRGDHAEAHRLAGKADEYANWSIGVGLVLGFLYFIAAIAAGT